jgi:hypothetical protein
MIRSLSGYFVGLFGLPSWHVKKGHGSFLTFEFGSPNQDISKVHEFKSSEIQVEKKRIVSIHGDWHLWIYCCGWKIFQESRLLSHDESDSEKIKIACSALDGQKIEDIEVELKSMNTRFSFDLGGYLETNPYSDEIDTQWYLYCPRGKVFDFRSDGYYSYEKGNTPIDKDKWVKIA